MMNIYWLRPRIGDALWLYYLLSGHAKFNANAEWFLVADGRSISDMEIGALLFCDEENVKVWRERLESVGLIRCALQPERDVFGHERRVIEFANTAFGRGAEPGLSLGSGAIN